MEQKKVIISSVCALIVGILIGAAFRTREHTPEPVMHHMESDMDSMSASLIGKTGDDFDRVFIDEMIVHHEGAVDMATLALTHAKHSEIKTLATAIIAAQNSEIEQMKNWQSKWYGEKQ